jgi:DMSO reductase anchor subunit
MSRLIAICLMVMGILLALTVISVFDLDEVKVWHHGLTTQIRKQAQTK